MIDDSRRWAAFHGVGTYQLLMEIHAAVEDTHGMILQGQPRVAAYCARDAVVCCLAVRSLATRGELWMEDQDPFYDPFSDCGEAEHALLSQIVGGLTRAGDDAEVDLAYRGLVDFVGETERLLGFSASPASIRTPQGMFPALRVARDLFHVMETAGLPQVLPKSWTATGKPPAEE
ncbi:hypothetical protein Rhe02_29710 [Rhizocola hellebori]|uniref:Uncharacterized protein n=1 Tax=Rhizocola hellebori TaxID=1392758 RepID=A0A8J3Q6L0_9ACTN|nr:hypothetical protein Rhe02_29710 [Rhizocola hellebori]